MDHHSLARPGQLSQAARILTVRSQFVIAAGGLLNNPKLPGIPGIEDFQGHSFHTSRWDYKYTAGSPTDPTLTNLKGKRVGIIGTGATAVQAVPHLAKYAKELYIFQRTPSSVDVTWQPPHRRRMVDHASHIQAWLAIRAHRQLQRPCNQRLPQTVHRHGQRRLDKDALLLRPPPRQLQHRARPHP